MTKYHWEKGHIPLIDVHSIKKHEIIQKYLFEYIRIVGGQNYHQRYLDLTLIDGFCGGGIYKKPDNSLHEGSPLILLKTAIAAAECVSKTKEFTLNPHYFFVDSQKPTVLFLKDLLNEHGFNKNIGNNIHLVCAEFETQVDSIIKYIKKPSKRANRCIFLLDQCGYSDVVLTTLSKIFNHLPNAEILLTFSTDYLLRFAQNTLGFQRTLKTVNISLDTKTLEETRRDDKEWKRVLQCGLYKDVINKSRAKYYTNFFIKPQKGNNAYWFLHLSMHPRARDAMQQLHWKLKNSFAHVGKPGLEMLGYDSKHDSYNGCQNFIFSDYDEKRNYDCLLEEIPDCLNDKGITFQEFLVRQCNKTPSTFSMIEQAVKKLYHNDDIMINTKSGKEKRRGASLQKDDVLRKKRQLKLFLNY